MTNNYAKLIEEILKLSIEEKRAIKNLLAKYINEEDRKRTWSDNKDPEDTLDEFVKEGTLKSEKIRTEVKPFDEMSDDELRKADTVTLTRAITKQLDVIEGEKKEIKTKPSETKAEEKGSVTTRASRVANNIKNRAIPIPDDKNKETVSAKHLMISYLIQDESDFVIPASYDEMKEAGIIEERGNMFRFKDDFIKSSEENRSRPEKKLQATPTGKTKSSFSIKEEFELIKEAKVDIAKLSPSPAKPITKNILKLNNSDVCIFKNIMDIYNDIYSDGDIEFHSNKSSYITIMLLANNLLDFLINQLDSEIKDFRLASIDILRKIHNPIVVDKLINALTFGDNFACDLDDYDEDYAADYYLSKFQEELDRAFGLDYDLSKDIEDWGPNEWEACGDDAFGRMEADEEYANKYYEANEVKIRAKEALIEMGDIIFDNLVTALRKNDENINKSDLIDILCEINNEKAIIPLIEIIQNSNENVNIRYKAITSLEKIIELPEIKELIKPLDYEMIKNEVIKKYDENHKKDLPF